MVTPGIRKRWPVSKDLRGLALICDRKVVKGETVTTHRLATGQPKQAEAFREHAHRRFPYRKQR